MCGVLGGFAKWLEQQLSDLGCVVREVDDLPGCVELIWDEDPEEGDDFDVSFLYEDPKGPSQSQIEWEAWDMGRCLYHNVSLEEDEDGVFCAECDKEAWETAAEARELARLEAETDPVPEEMYWTDEDYELWDACDAMRRQLEFGISHCRRCGLPLPQVRDEDGTHYGVCPCRRRV